MDVLEVIKVSKQILADIMAGNVVAAWESSLPLQKIVIDSLKATGFRGKAPCTCEQLAEIKSCWGEIAKVCEIKAGVVENRMVSADLLGKIGDGKLLQLLLEILIKIAPLIPLFFEPQT